MLNKQWVDIRALKITDIKNTIPSRIPRTTLQWLDIFLYSEGEYVVLLLADEYWELLCWYFVQPEYHPVLQLKRMTRISTSSVIQFPTPRLKEHPFQPWTKRCPQAPYPLWTWCPSAYTSRTITDWTMPTVVSFLHKSEGFTGPFCSQSLSDRGEVWPGLCLASSALFTSRTHKSKDCLSPVWLS